MCPPLGRWAIGAPGRLPAHCLLVETPRSGLVLVDTALGLGDIADPRRLGPSRAMLGAVLDPAETALRQVEALGFSPSDVRHIVLTHLDLDHAGGVGDFPWADVHVLAAEHDAARARRTLAERSRYRPAHVDAVPEGRWRLHSTDGEAWMGLPAARELAGLEGFALVPLVGHTRGHAGVAVHSDRGWLLHVGDAVMHGDALLGRRIHPGLAAFQWASAVERCVARQTRDTIARWLAGPGASVRAFCAHDAGALAALQAEATATRQ